MTLTTNQMSTHRQTNEMLK